MSSTRHAPPPLVVTTVRLPAAVLKQVRRRARILRVTLGSAMRVVVERGEVALRQEERERDQDGSEKR